MSEDPIGFDGGDANQRRYVSNKAVEERDPEGLKVLDEHPTDRVFYDSLLGFGYAHPDIRNNLARDTAAEIMKFFDQLEKNPHIVLHVKYISSDPGENPLLDFAGDAAKQRAAVAPAPAFFIYIGHGIEPGRVADKTLDALKDLSLKLGRNDRVGYFGCWPQQFNEPFGDRTLPGVPDDKDMLEVSKIYERFHAAIGQIKAELRDLISAKSTPTVHIFVYFGEHFYGVKSSIDKAIPNEFLENPRDGFRRYCIPSGGGSWRDRLAR